MAPWRAAPAGRQTADRRRGCQSVQPNGILACPQCLVTLALPLPPSVIAAVGEKLLDQRAAESSEETDDQRDEGCCHPLSMDSHRLRWGVRTPGSSALAPRWRGLSAGHVPGGPSWPRKPAQEPPGAPSAAASYSVLQASTPGGDVGDVGRAPCWTCTATLSGKSVRVGDG